MKVRWQSVAAAVVSLAGIGLYLYVQMTDTLPFGWSLRLQYAALAAQVFALCVYKLELGGKARRESTQS